MGAISLCMTIELATVSDNTDLMDDLFFATVRQIVPTDSQAMTATAFWLGDADAL